MFKAIHSNNWHQELGTWKILKFDLFFFLMAEKLPFGEGASRNRPPLLCGLNWKFWKVRTKIFVESLDKGIWDAIENDPFIPKLENDGVFIEKPWSQWADAENKRAKFDCIEKNIITSTLNSDEFFRVSRGNSWRNERCKEGKETYSNPKVWDVQNAQRTINCGCAKTVHSHCQSPHESWKSL